MSQYCYFPLSPEPDRIRLLRLMPHEDETADIQCQLFEYSLQDSCKKTHLYEALSYVWGDPDEKQPIFIDEHRFDVTANLRAALSRLRNHSMERMLWVDAICIDQANNKEKENQIQSMAKIYGQANRVIVWLGEEADDSDQALEDIRVAAEEESTYSLDNNQKFIALLQRSWFERIWVLQEIALARRVLILCGPAEINGLALCSGLNGLKLSDGDYPGLQALIRSVTYLIRGAIFRPKYAVSSAGGVSLGELIDMYHTRKATIRHDKVYALLGMSSDDSSAAGLSPNYALPWKNLLRQLIEFLLCKVVSVETWDERERAVIKSKGCVVGQVSLVTNDSIRYDRQQVNISFKNTPGSLEYQRKWGAQWTLQASAKSIRQGDLVCLLEGASKPTIIRTYKDHFDVIIIAVAPRQGVQAESRYVECQWPLPSIKSFPRDFLLVWNWEKPSGNLQGRARYETSIEINALVPKYSSAASNRATRLYDVALILGDLEEYEEARKRLQEATKGYEGISASEHPHQLASIENLALIHKKNKEWREAEEKFYNIANLASTYIDQSNLEIEELVTTQHLANRIRENAQITETELVQVVRSTGEEMLALLLGLRRGNVLITEEVVKAAAGNSARGKERNEVTITEEVVKAAAGNSRSGKEVITLLLDQRGNEVTITEEAVVQIARSFDEEVMALLFKRRANEVTITEEVVKAAAGNLESGKEVMTLLLDRRGNEVTITEEVVKAAAGNSRSGKEVMTLLLDRRGNEVIITEEVVKVAAGNYWRGHKVMALLLDRRGNEVTITEEVVKAAAGNSRSGKEVMTLLLDRRGNEVTITEEVVKAAAGNSRSGKEVMTLLLDRRGNEVTITEEVVKAAAGNLRSGNRVMTLLLDRRGNEVTIGNKVMAFLLDRRGNEVTITEEAVVQIARSFDEEVMALLFKRRGNEVTITEEVVKAAAGNVGSGNKVMALLLDRRVNEVTITEEVVKAAAGNSARGKEVMTLLLDRRGNEVTIIEEVVIQIARSFDEEVMALLLDQRGNEVIITEEVVKAVAGNYWSGKEVMTLLLNRRGNEVIITEEVVKVAAGNLESGKEVMTLLLDRRGNEATITEEAVVQIARSFNEEVIALTGWSYCPPFSHPAEPE
ncbi:heterokaryon incompatibility protein-domain-containing protein [Phaeosphaeriaceae sp. PMI808]|nr:heterokaryon incompatibility protein-domain-containing protein [Phaeosphaeriaceae sp. PMI808]